MKKKIHTKVIIDVPRFKGKGVLEDVLPDGEMSHPGQGFTWMDWG